jgi:hypothetical protein
LLWGWPNVDALMESMSDAQARMWIRFYRRYPFDPESMYFKPAAAIAASIVNANGGVKGKAIGVDKTLDMIRDRPPEKPVSLDEKFRRMFASKKQPEKPA